MKHGPNALIDETLPVVCIATQDPADPSSVLKYEKTLSNIQEVTARSGRVIAIAVEGDTHIAQLVEHVIHIPAAPELLLPILEVVPLQLEEEIGCRVFLGEHNELITSYRKAVGQAVPADHDLKLVNLTLFEANLADYVDLIVILPDSPGSFAELGMFSVAPNVCPKLLLIIDQKYEGASSFIVRGPVLAAKNNRAQVEYVSYDDKEAILSSVRAEVIRIRETLASQDLWRRKTNR